MNEKPVKLQCEIAHFKISGISAERDWPTDQSDIAVNALYVVEIR